MSRIKTIIIDDEQLARKRIRRLLEHDVDIHIVAEFGEGNKAIEFIMHHQVDLVYLDIHMPKLDGFAVLKRIPEHTRPFIIFATADKESALYAYEHKALDYLLKPFRNTRFYDSLKRAKHYISLEKNAASTNNEHQEGLSETNTEYDDFIYMKTDGNYVRMYHDSSDFILKRITMAEMEEELKGTTFLRIHRSICVNMYFVKHVLYLGNSEYQFELSFGETVRSGRSYRHIISEYIDQNKRSSAVSTELRTIKKN